MLFDFDREALPLRQACLSREIFTKRFIANIAILTNLKRYRKTETNLTISRLQRLCFENDITLYEFFHELECPEEDYGNSSYFHEITLESIYTVIDKLAEEQNLSDYIICKINDWDFSNYRREKNLALEGKRKTFKIQKLYDILSIIDISFTAFFSLCEKEEQEKGRKHKAPRSEYALC